jgi:hypothetical protein
MLRAARLSHSHVGVHMAQVELAKEMKEKGVVGIDLSGNPEVGCWETWLPALHEARNVCTSPLLAVLQN